MDRKFLPGDLVTCDESHEIQQPMRVVGRNPWFVNSNNVLYIAGKHKRNGSEITITLTSDILKSYEPI